VLEVLKALIGWIKAPEQTSLRRAFTVWLERVFLAKRLQGIDFETMNDLQEVRGMLSERIDSWEKQWEPQGIAKGLQKGLEQGLQHQRQMLYRLIRKRFGADIVEQGQPLLDGADDDTWLQALRTATHRETKMRKDQTCALCGAALKNLTTTFTVDTDSPKTGHSKMVAAL
jgi:hypothetical protein